MKAEIRSALFRGKIDGLKLLMAMDESLAKAEVHFIGIVAKEIDLGTDLSEDVEKALPKAIEIVGGLCKGQNQSGTEASLLRTKDSGLNV